MAKPAEAAVSEILEILYPEHYSPDWDLQEDGEYSEWDAETIEHVAAALSRHGFGPDAGSAMTPEQLEQMEAEILATLQKQMARSHLRVVKNPVGALRALLLCRSTAP